MGNPYLEAIKERFKNAFDVKYRVVNYGCGEVTLVYIDNLCDTKFISDFIVTPLVENKIEIDCIEIIKTKVLRANAVGDINKIDEAFNHIVSGDVVLIFKNFDYPVYCEAKGFVKRSVDVPKTEAVLKGPREGLNEAIMDNVALIRKRVKNYDLKTENMTMGDKSNTVVIIMYIKDVAPEDLVNQIKNSLSKLKYDFVLDTNYIQENLGATGTPFDTVGFTEKPDIVAAKIMEGRVAIIVDGTPFIATVPFFFIENFQTPDDYYLNRFYSNSARLLRWAAFLISTFLPGLYIAITTYHFSLIPSVFILRLAVSRAGVPFPTIVEVILMITFFQIIKEAGLRLPQPIGQAMSIVGALILGDAATGAGLTSQSTVFVVALGSICYFLVSKLYGASSLWSVALVIFGGLLGLPGFYIGFFMLITQIASLHSCGYPFLYPMGTKNKYGYKDILIRAKLESISKNILNGNDE